MRVLHIPNTHWYQRALVNSLRGAGVEVSDLTVGWGEYLPAWEERIVGSGVGILHLHWPESMLRQKAMGLPFRILRKIRLKLTGQNEDWARWLHENECTLTRLKEAGIRLVWTVHNLLPHSTEDTNRPAYGQLYECFARHADAAIHHSECGMRRTRDTYAFSSRCRHSIIRHGYFEDELSEKETSREARHKLGIRSDATVFLTVGRIDPRKSLEVLARAFLEVSDPALTLVLVGSGSNDYVETLRAEFAGVVDVVFAGACTQADLSRYARASDALVFSPAAGEELTSGAPHLSQGFLLPQITTASPYTVEVLGGNAIYYDGTPVDLAARLRDVSRRTRLPATGSGQAGDAVMSGMRDGLGAARQEYSWPCVAGKTRQLYAELGAIES